jgi:purine-binding chemotaxis protein CheW
MASRKKNPKNAIPHDPFEDMELLDSLIPDEAEIPESIIDGIAADNRAVDASEGEPQATTESEAQIETRVEIDDSDREEAETEVREEHKSSNDLPTPGKSEDGVDEEASNTAETVAAIEIEVLDDIKDAKREIDTSPEFDTQVDDDPGLVEVPEPIDDLKSGFKDSDRGEKQGSQLLDENIATTDNEMETTFGTGMMPDLTPEIPRAVGEEQHLIFTLAGKEYTTHISNLTEIGYPPSITPLPNVPEWILGLANLRGDVISMIDLREFLGIGKMGHRQDVRMLVAKTLQEDSSVGLIVDSVSGIRYLRADQIGEPTASIEKQTAAYVRGTYDLDGRLLVVLDLERLLSAPKMRQFEPA